MAAVSGQDQARPGSCPQAAMIDGIARLLDGEILDFQEVVL